MSKGSKTSKDVGSISNLEGHDTSRALFFLRKQEHFLKIRRAFLCLLQNLGGGTCPQCPPAPTSMLQSFQKQQDQTGN